MAQTDKVAFLQRLDAYTRSLDPRVTQVSISLGGVHDTVLVAASDGTWAGDVRPLVRLNISVIIEHNGRRERGSFGGGGRTDYRFFEDRKSTRLNSSHVRSSYAVFCLKKKK